MKNLFKNFFLILIIFLSISYLFSLYTSKGVQIEKIGLEKLIQQINNEEVSSIVVSGDNLEINLKDDRQQSMTRRKS